MRLAFPPPIGSVYRSPSSSNRIVRPSGERSRETQVPSVAVKRRFRLGMSGRELAFAAALAELSFWVGVWAWARPAISVATKIERGATRDMKARNCDLIGM